MNSSNKKSDSLMGDLESIRALLEEDNLASLSVPQSLSQALHPTLEMEIPLLRESLSTFDPRTGVSSPVLAAAEPVEIEHFDDFDDASGHISAEELADLQELEALHAQGLDPELAPDPNPDLAPDLDHLVRRHVGAETSLDGLLGDEFHNATAEVLQRARSLIQQHPNQWSPQQTDELTDALRVRIDDTVQQWIQTSLAAHATQLQQRLLNTVRHELARHLDVFESSSD